MMGPGPGHEQMAVPEGMEGEEDDEELEGESSSSSSEIFGCKIKSFSNEVDIRTKVFYIHPMPF